MSAERAALVGLSALFQSEDDQMNEADHYFETILLRPLRQYASNLKIQQDEHNPAIERLLELGKTYDRIADLGCGIGERTIALMLRLRAVEIVGIDKEQDKIDRALTQVIAQKLEPIKQQIQKIRQILGPDDQIELSDDVRKEIEEYGSIPIPDYRKGDITKGKDGTGLQCGYYDLAYCRYVLYHIYCEEKGTSYANTRLAIQEMARISRPGGLIVAYEPNVCSSDDGTQVDLKPFFEEQEELQFVDQVLLDGETVYIYRRE